MTTMSLNIQEAQRNAVSNMLALECYEKDSVNPAPTQIWKILIYDRVCQNMLSPLVKVGSLRQHGVTLNLLLEAERSPVTDVPVVYIVEPSMENIDRILHDMKKGYYRRYYINFSTSISKEVLEHFAVSASKMGCADLVNAVVDRFLQFVSISPFEFSLDLPDAFTVFHGTQAKDQEIEACLARICDGLLSVIITLGAVPVIRYPSTPTSPARLLAEQLNERLRALLSLREINQLLPRGGMRSSSLERPLLILTDREVDFNVMLHHTWSYQALVHDLFELRLNRVTLPGSAAAGSGDVEKPKTFDIDSSDTLWAEYGYRAFPEAAVAISDAFQEYSARKAQLDQGSTESWTESGPNTAAGVQSALLTLNAVPEMVVKKKSIDMHTNIAHAVVAEITSRGLDKLYETEDAFESASAASAFAQLERMLESSEKGTIADKKRAAFCFYFARQGQLNPSQLKRLKDKLRALDPSSSALEFLQQLQSFKSMQKATAASTSLSTSATIPQPSSSTNWGANLIDRSKGLLQGVRNLLPLKKTFPLSAITNELMQNRPGSLDHEFKYLDPKMALFLNVDDSAVPRVKSAFKQGIVFVLGGGSYVESQALKDMATRTGKQIVYGSTDFVTPVKFMEQLERLGSSM